MPAIVVTALAVAGATRKINAVFPPPPPVWQPFGPTTDMPQAYCDDATSAQMAALLPGCTVIKMVPRSYWRNGDPTRLTMEPAPAANQNYLSFPDQPGAPSPQALLIVNAGDIACACEQGYYFMAPPLALEEVLAALIWGSIMSDAATAALAYSPVPGWEINVQPTWYTLPVTP
jgi:hypothetical protein